MNCKNCAHKNVCEFKTEAGEVEKEVKSNTNKIPVSFPFIVTVSCAYFCSDWS